MDEDSQQHAIEAYNRGVAHFKNTEFDKAIKEFTKAIQFAPEYAEAFFDRGRAYAPRDQSRGIADFTEAIRLRPDYAEAYFNRGFAHEVQGSSDKAIADYTEAIQLNPRYARAYVSRGLAYARSVGDFEKAIADLTEAIQVNPNDRNIYKARSELYKLTGDQAKAEADMAKVLELMAEPD